MKIIPIGGRIKAASIGLDRLSAGTSAELDRAIAELRRSPCEHMRRAFFPRVGNELRHMTHGIGLYRPILKTDQGMPGNFLPFSIDLSLAHTDVRVRRVMKEEGVIIPEAWHVESCEAMRTLQSAFLKMDLAATYEGLQQFENRRAEKGRWPCMFIRPALLDHPIIFGNDIVKRVEQSVQEVLARCVALGQEREHVETGKIRSSNVLWVQPDVYVLTDGTIVVEKINCPDVGFFLASVVSEGSSIMPHIKATIRSMFDIVAQRIIAAMGTHITIVTRDKVLCQQEDVLEIREIEILQAALRTRGVTVDAIPASSVRDVKAGTRLLLLNLDYRAEETHIVLERHAANDIVCFPNPYVQMACADVTGLSEFVMMPGDKNRNRFLQLARSQPSSDAARDDVLRQIDKALSKNGIVGEIVHVHLETEMVPVLRNAMHAWRQLATRADRPENASGRIRFRSIPARADNLLITSDTGARLHAFRFMAVA